MKGRMSNFDYCNINSSANQFKTNLYLRFDRRLSESSVLQIKNNVSKSKINQKEIAFQFNHYLHNLFSNCDFLYPK